MITFDVPNLDAEDAGDLTVFASVLELLGRYARLKATAQAYRQRGQVDDALKFERRCESVYNALPTWAKW